MKLLRLTPVILVTLGLWVYSANAQTLLLEETFDGGGMLLDGTTVETLDMGIVAAGGSPTWDSSADFLDNGEVVAAQGNSSAFISLGSYIDDTKGNSNGLFVLEWTVSDITTAGNRWIGIGFSNETSPSNGSHFLTEGGTATLILRSAGDVDGFVPGMTALMGPQINNTAHTLSITLDLRDHNGIDNFGTVSFATDLDSGTVDFDYTEDQSFVSLLLSNNSDTAGSISAMTLTQAEGDDVLLGDVNCDGTVNLLDVQPFVDLLTNGGFSVKADVNEDGELTLLDVGPFVDIISGG